MAEIFKTGSVRAGSEHTCRDSSQEGKRFCELTTLLWAISWRMLGVTRLQNSSAVRIAVKLNSFWLWTFVATALCSQYTVQSWAKINAWKSEHMCSTEVWGRRKGRGVTLLGLPRRSQRVVRPSEPRQKEAAPSDTLRIHHLKTSWGAALYSSVGVHLENKASFQREATLLCRIKPPTPLPFSEADISIPELSEEK